MRSPAPRGVALIFVLWLLVVLGVAASEVLRQARHASSFVTTARARSVGRYAAESGIVLATSRLETLLDTVRAPANRAAAFRREARPASIPEVTLGDARFGVAVIDLNARLDLNRTDVTTLENLLQRFVSATRAADIVASVKRQPLRRVEELARVASADDSVALAAGPYLTVWSDGLVNVNSASEAVLAAVPGIGAAAAASIVRRREGGEVFTSTDGLKARGAPGPLLTIVPTRILIVSRGWQLGHPLTHEIDAVYLISGQQLILQSWKERDL